MKDMKAKKEILPEEIWNSEKSKSLTEFVLHHSALQSEEQRLKNKLLSIRYQVEDFLEAADPASKLQLIDVVNLYARALNVTKKKLAQLLDMDDSNLHKYLTGQRKLNADFVLKISAFTHLEPEYWLRLEVKNEVIELKSKNLIERYLKYDYQKLLSARA